MKAVLVLSAALLLALLGAVPAGGEPAPTGQWRLKVKLVYTSTGTATADNCRPDPTRPGFRTLEATARERVTIRTTNQGTVEFRETPGGGAVARETAFRAQLETSRRTGLSRDGRPIGCDGKGGRKRRCEAERRTGIHLRPNREGGHWNGFVIEPRRVPTFGGCPVTDAQGKGPDPLEIVVKARPRALTGRARKLTIRGREQFRRRAGEAGVESVARGVVHWTVTLISTDPGPRPEP